MYAGGEKMEESKLDTKGKIVTYLVPKDPVSLWENGRNSNQKI
jgi:hypothetical protein